MVTVPICTSQNVYIRWFFDHESDLSVSSDNGECHNVYEKEIGVDRRGHPLVCSNDGGVAVKYVYSETLQRIIHC